MAIVGRDSGGSVQGQEVGNGDLYRGVLKNRVKFLKKGYAMFHIIIFHNPKLHFTNI